MFVCRYICTVSKSRYLHALVSMQASTCMHVRVYVVLYVDCQLLFVYDQLFELFVVHFVRS
jgi:hypothetical protein